MSRPILPFPPPHRGGQPPFRLSPPDPPLHPPPPPPPPPPSKPTYAKRGRITIVACLPCRRRKTKCDGKRPACSQCRGRDGQCQYDMTDEQRRLTYLRENVEHLEREKSELESLLLTLQRASESDVAEVMRALRMGNDLHTLARDVHAGRLLSKARTVSSPRNGSRSGYTNSPPTLRSSPQLEQYQSLVHAIVSAQPLELSEIVRRLRAGHEPASILASADSDTLVQTLSSEAESTLGMETEFSGREQFGLVKGAGPSGPQDAQNTPDALSSPVNHWTNVTQDDDWIEHLLSLYFSWQHQFFQNFPEQLFRDDMASRRTNYCSELLVNALCAAGCLFSNSRRARRDQDDPGTAGLDFYEEAVRLANEEQVSALTTTAALSVLCHIEGNFTRLSSQWHYSGRSSRMALDLNLHLCNDTVPNDQQSGELVEDNVRGHVFWGCFITDQVTSFTLGRIPLIPNNAITVDIPPVDATKDEAEWIAHGQVSQLRKSFASTTFRQVIRLSKIVNSTLQIFFAPSRTISGSLLLDEYNKYTQWYAKLPAAVQSVENAPPHVISLQMYYHAAILLLFRPFLKARFTESSVSPREVCRHSANTISYLFERHRQTYGLDGIFTFQLHCLLTACTIHIIKLPSISATSHLTAACNSFQDLVKHNQWATGNLDIIRSLVQKWKIVLPLEVEHALYRDQTLPPSISESPPTTTSNPSEIDFNNTQIGPTSKSILSMSRPEKREAHSFSPPAAPQVLPKRPRLAASLLHDCGNPTHSPTGNTFSSVPQSLTTGTTMTKTTMIATNADTATTTHQQMVTRYLFAPFPHQQAPLLGPIHTSTSHDGWEDENGTERGDAWSEELHRVSQGFDGLNFVADDGFDPFMGYNGDRI